MWSGISGEATIFCAKTFTAAALPGNAEPVQLFDNMRK